MSPCCMQGPSGGSVNFYWLEGGGAVSTHPTMSFCFCTFLHKTLGTGYGGCYIEEGVIEGRKRKALMMRSCPAETCTLMGICKNSLRGGGSEVFMEIGFCLQVYIHQLQHIPHSITHI